MNKIELNFVTNSNVYILKNVFDKRLYNDGHFVLASMC